MTLWLRLGKVLRSFFWFVSSCTIDSSRKGFAARNSLLICNMLKSWQFLVHPLLFSFRVTLLWWVSRLSWVIHHRKAGSGSSWFVRGTMRTICRDAMWRSTSVRYTAAANERSFSKSELVWVAGEPCRCIVLLFSFLHLLSVTPHCLTFTPSCLWNGGWALFVAPQPPFFCVRSNRPCFVEIE